MVRLGVLLFLLSLLLPNSARVKAAWQTLDGKPPLVIANGGTSGLYPDQTAPAYIDALNYSLPNVILSCDLQLVKTASGLLQGLCRTGLNLKDSTNIDIVYPEKNNTYIINGASVTGWFTPDFTFEEIRDNVTAKQRDLNRPSWFDGAPIFTPESVSPNSGLWWLNSESKSFFEEHGLNVTQYLIEFLPKFPPAPMYLSANEITLLRTLQPTARTVETKLIFKFLDKESIEPSTNRTYGSLLANLSDIATFASGILVPKTYIWPTIFDKTVASLQPHTSLVDDAHNANLEVHAYDFANDQYPLPYNYSFDPVTELLAYIENYNFSVDGIVTDFPTTASEAIACYASSSNNGTKTGVRNKTIISHNGNSGDWPGCTLPAYTSALDAGVDYIDCSVQITKDGVLICRESPNLGLSTNVGTVPTLLEPYLKTDPELGQGVFTFDLTWSQIQSNLKGIIYSPSQGSDIYRDMSHDGMYDILTFADFLSLAKNHSTGAFIDIQNAVYIRENKSLAVVDAVAQALTAAGYTDPSEKVIIQSEDSSALARLRTLNVTYPLTYRIPLASGQTLSVTAADFVDIKRYATSVSIPKKLVLPLDPSGLSLPSQIVQLAHAQNLTVYLFFLRNEPLVFPFDYKIDATMEMFTYSERYNIDGFITDFPTTTINYFENHCLPNGNAALQFVIPDVEAGLLSSELGPLPPTAAPIPDLVVPEPPLPGAQPLSPAPSPVPASASQLSTCLSLTAAFSVLFHFLSIL